MDEQEAASAKIESHRQEAQVCRDDWHGNPKEADCRQSILQDAC